MKKILPIIITVLFTGCDFGPPAKINEDFVSCNDLNIQVKFEDLIGNY